MLSKPLYFNGTDTHTLTGPHTHKCTIQTYMCTQKGTQRSTHTDIHVCIHKNAHRCTHTDIPTHRYTHTDIHMCTHKYIHRCTHADIHTCTCTDAYIWTYTLTNAHIQIYTHMHTKRYTQMHTYRHTQNKIWFCSLASVCVLSIRDLQSITWKDEDCVSVAEHSHSTCEVLGSIPKTTEIKRERKRFSSNVP